MDDYNVKQIGDFPSATDITDDDVLLAEQAGKTRKLSGKVLKDFCRAAISAFTTRAETAATAAEAAKNAAAEIEQLIGEKAGVASFRGRSGLVVPMAGDYDYKMVGAVGGVESTEHPGCYYRMVGDAVEWFNPPMIPSKEYRTTERWNGKPVYVRLFRCAPLPDSSSATFDVLEDANVAQIVEVHGVALHNDSANSTAIYLPWTSDDAILLDAVKYNNGKVSVFIKTNSNQITYTGYVTIKYTKK